LVKALLLALMVLCGAIGTVVAQKKNTLVGDVVIGELTAKDETTGEITVKYPGKEGPEIFNGILGDGYKLRMGEGGLFELQLSEIVPGLHVRVFYKSGRAKVNGQEKKINKITRLEVLGTDAYFRLRNQLELPQSTAVARAEKDDLPAVSPLKVYVSVAYGYVHQQFVAWIDKWNRKNADSYGKLEHVSDLGQADILIVVARGADTMVAVLPMVGGPVEGEWSQGTSYLVVKDAQSLKVLWTGIAAVFSGPRAETSPRIADSMIAEMEKRMKARARNPKK
jgi:hypothetical protein